LSSGGAEPFWIAPNSIRFKISPIDDLHGIVGGDWDLDRRYLLSEAVKHVSIAQRYDEGRKWEDTDLFRGPYARRIEAGESVRGEATMKGLLHQYYTRVDDMFDDLRRNGFDANRGPLPGLLIGRDGEVFIGNQGNHRLAMSQLLDLKKFAGTIVCRWTR
jgi:hypothetical protein